MSWIGLLAMTRQEEILQAKCYLWFHNTFPLWRKMLFHVDNNSWNAVIGAKKKSLGVNAGVSDFVLILFAEVIWIEMKTLDGEQNDEQKIFQEKVEKRGHKYIILRDFENFCLYITEKIKESDEYLRKL